MSQYMKAMGLAALVALAVFVACEQISQPNAPDSRTASDGTVKEKALVVPGGTGPAPVTSGGPPVAIPSGGGGGGSVPVAIPSGGSKNPVAIPGGGGGGGNPSPTPTPSGSPSGSPTPTPTPSSTPQPGSATFTNNNPIGPNPNNAPTVQFVTVSGVPAGAQIVSATMKVWAKIPNDSVVQTMVLAVNQSGDTVYDVALTAALSGADLGSSCTTATGFDDASAKVFPGTTTAPYLGTFKPQNAISGLFTAANTNPNSTWTFGIGPDGTTIIINCLSLTVSWQ